MPNPSNRWDGVPVWGVYLTAPGETPQVGSCTMKMLNRVSRADGRVIYSGGAAVTVTIGDTTQQDTTVRNAVRTAWRTQDEAAAGAGFDGLAWDTWWDDVIVPAAIFTRFPALDDPDVVLDPTNRVRVKESLVSGTGREYDIRPLLAHLDLPIPGVNLGTVEVPPGSPVVPAPVYAKGIAGGVASLDETGKIPVEQIPDGIGLDEAALATYLGDGQYARTTDIPTALPPTDGSVTAAKIADGAVTAAKVAPGVIPTVPSTLPPTDGSVTAEKMATGLVAMTTAERTRLADTPSLSLGLDHTGATDIGPTLQSLYDSGQQKVTLRRGGTYRLDTPVFLDSDRFGDKFELDLNGATIVLGASLPMINGAFPADATVRVAFHVNTLRSALSAGNVDVQAGKATSSGASLRFVLRNGRIEAGAVNAIVAFGNRCGALMESVNLYGGRALWSWYDYAEPHIMRHCHFQTAGASQPADAFLLYGAAKGDGVRVESIKCDGAVGGVSLSGCFGAVIDSVISSKIRLTACAGIVITGAHQESDLYASYQPNVEVYRSDVRVVGGAWYPPQDTTRACIEIDDTDANNNQHSTVTITGAEAKYLGKGDAAQGSLVRVQAVNTRNNTLVTVRDLSSKTSGVSATGAGTWRATALPPITSAVSAVQTAIDAGVFQIASGSFELGRVDGAWLLYEPGSAGWRRSRALTAPTFTQIVNATDVTGGTLASGQVYEYAVAAVDGEGNYTTHSTSSYTAGTALANRILLNNTKNMTVILWRKTGTGVASAPDVYVVLPSVTNNLILFDHGANISGRPWVSTSVPVPATVAAANATRSRASVGSTRLATTAEVDTRAPLAATPPVIYSTALNTWPTKSTALAALGLTGYTGRVIWHHLASHGTFAAGVSPTMPATATADDGAEWTEVPA